jgi:hypothetical protein
MEPTEPVYFPSRPYDPTVYQSNPQERGNAMIDTPVQTLKVGNGRLIALYTDSDQPGKTLALFDGETVLLSHLPLDKVLTHIELLEDGTEKEEPGLPLNLAFVTELRVQTDGQVDISWQ